MLHSVITSKLPLWTGTGLALTSKDSISKKMDACFVPVSLKCRGDISLREIVEVSLTAGINVPPKERVKQSGQIRRRHPFFIQGNLKHSSLF